MKLRALLILTALLTSGTGVAGTGAISFSPNSGWLNMLEGEAGKTATLERTGGNSGSVTVTVTAVPVPSGLGRTPVSPNVAYLEYRLPPPGAWTPLYWNESFNITFADTMTSASFEIRPLNNNAYEVGQVWGSLALGNVAAPATLGEVPSRSFDIVNDDPQPMLLSAPVVLPEGSGNTPVLHLVQVVLDRPVAGFPENPFIRPMPNFFAALEGVDFRLPNGGIPADWVQYYSSFTIPIEVIPDSIYEGDEPLDITSGLRFLGGDIPVHLQITIQDDDPAPVLSIAPASVVEGNSGTTALNFTVSLNAPATAPVRFYWSTVVQFPVPTGRFAGDGSDFTGVSGSVDIPAGSLSATLSVTVHGDTSYELDETFEVFIDPSGAIVGTGRAIGTILNDDPAPVLIMGAPGATSLVEPDLLSASNVYTDVSFSLSSSAGQGLTRQVSYSITAPEGTVISPASGTLNFPTNAPVNLRLYVRGDTIPEFNAPVTITFSNPQNLQLTQTTAPLFTVIDNDQYGIQISSPSVTEGQSGGSTLRYSVSLAAPALRDIGLNYFTSHGTANAADYTAASGALTIAAGLTAATVDVIVLGDTLVETDETILLNVSSTDVLVAPGTVSAPGTILFDDYGSPPAPVGTLVTEIESGPELLAWFSVAMPASVVPVTCRVSTRDGTATAADNDYRALGNAPLTFAPGETSKWVAVAVTAASKEEAREQFFLDVQHSVTGAVRSAPCTIERLSITQFWRPFPQFFAMRFPTGLGQRYVVYEAASLTGPWTPSSSILTGTGFPVTQTMFSEFDIGFFRVQTAPPLPPGTAAVGP